MKKSLIALIIASVFVLSACDDKTSQKLLDTEKRLVQLESSFKKSEENLALKENELANVKTELNRLKAQEETFNQQSFPALNVEIVKLFDKQETLKFPKDPSDEFAREESEVAVFASMAKTGIDWLDELLLTHLMSSGSNDSLAKMQKPINLQTAQTFFDEQYRGLINSAKEDKGLGYIESAETYYIGQRNNIATFTQSFYSYSGGAHGMGYTNYLNIDTNKKTIIQLDDLISPKNQPKLRELLWENYTRDRLDENGKFSEDFMTKKEFTISNNFYFTANGITFVYPVYQLGPYAEGEVELAISFAQLKDLVNNVYFSPEKDGFGLNTHEF